MKISLKWLREYVEIALPPDELAHRLTMAGIEVSDVHAVGSAWRDVHVARIKAVSPHPNADRLQLAVLDLEGRAATVVTGAPNIQAGDMVPYAREGATILDPETGSPSVVRSATIRGVKSEGVLCSERELGIGEDHTGIMILPPDVPVGAPLVDVLGNVILDLELTPNRPDCLSVHGIAREVGALTGRRARPPSDDYPEASPSAQEIAAVEIWDPDLCPRYTASVIRGVRIGPSPAWMQERLIASGMRPINNIVDITNYVMLELGQPLHAFDYDLVAGRRIIVRRARPDERMTTLDGVERALTPEILVIADAERAVAVAGVMGGSDSEVSDSTVNILLESANFNRTSIRRASASLRMRTEASLRFEKGLSPDLTVYGLRRATQLMVQLAGGTAARGLVDVYPGPPSYPVIELTPREVRRILGASLTVDEIVRTLEGLEFDCRVVDTQTGSPAPAPTEPVIHVSPPFYRTDVSHSYDVIEEVARIVGYDNLPMTTLSGRIPELSADPLSTLGAQMREILVACGLQEVITYSLVSRQMLESVRSAELTDELDAIKLSNPMTPEQEYLRTSMRPSLLRTLAANERRDAESIKLFELGRIYLPRPSDLPDERRVVSGVLTGLRHPRNWAVGAEELDFYDAKGIVESLFGRLGFRAEFRRSADSGLHPGKAADVTVAGTAVGVCGEVHPALRKRFDILSSHVYLFEIDLPMLLSCPRTSQEYQPLARFPGVERALAVVVPLDVPAERVRDLIQASPSVRNLRLFDVYVGDQVPAGKKSLAYAVTFGAPERTLTDREADDLQLGIVERLQRELGATLRSS